MSSLYIRYRAADSTLTFSGYAIAVNESALSINNIGGTLSPTKGGTGVANNAASTLTITGAFSLGLTLSANTSLTLPTTGTLPTLQATQNFTGVNTFGAAATNTMTNFNGSLQLTTNAAANFLDANAGVTLGSGEQYVAEFSDNSRDGVLIGLRRITAGASSNGFIALNRAAAGNYNYMWMDAADRLRKSTNNDLVGTTSGDAVAQLTDHLGSFASTTSAQLSAIISDRTGSGQLVFATTPTFVTPNLGTPNSGNLSNCTAFPVGSLSGLGANVATFLATPSSANLASAVTDETGSGLLVFGTTPTLTTPKITTNGSIDVTGAGTLTIGASMGANALTLGGTTTSVVVGASGGTAAHAINGSVQQTLNGIGLFLDVNAGGTLGSNQNLAFEIGDSSRDGVLIGLRRITGGGSSNGFVALNRSAASTYNYFWTDTTDRLRKSIDNDHVGTTSGTAIATLSDDLGQFSATTSAQLAGVISDETGSGSLVFATSPTLVTPVLGTPSSGNLSNCTAFPVAQLSGLGTGIATFLATPSSANLASAITNETGSGLLVFATSPTLTTPLITTNGSIDVTAAGTLTIGATVGNSVLTLGGLVDMGAGAWSVRTTAGVRVGNISSLSGIIQCQSTNTDTSNYLMGSTSADTSATAVWKIEGRTDGGGTLANRRIVEFTNNGTVETFIAANGANTWGPSGGGITHRINSNTTATGTATLTLTNGPGSGTRGAAVYLTLNINGTDYVIPAFTTS